MAKTTERDHVLFHLQQRFNLVRVEVALIKLLNCKATIIAPLKDLIDYVREEVIFLGKFPTDSLEQCKEQTKITDIFTLVQSATSQAWSFFNSLSHDSKQEDLTDEVKKFYYGLLLLATYFLDPLVQCMGCKKQNNLVVGFGTLVIEAESAISLSYEDSNKSRKVNLVLQFLTEAFKFVNLLKHRATLKAEILDLIERAHEELIFLGAFLMDVLRQHTELNIFNDLLMHAEVTALKLAQISGSCYVSFMDGSSTEKMRLSLSDYLQEIESVKVKVREKASPCNMTSGEGLINFYQASRRGCSSTMMLVQSLF
ncbi:hypothetical protein A4A49_20524 [Nicotiana attenuata]|uniref:Uncharacterized protein n=1 Tax=Nicotiana attenuata TaxID=49451 RepID=A0A314KL99_NICAT|nr:hypothetical protein A4A49_20524 [Nicotiana attenuata]